MARLSRRAFLGAAGAGLTATGMSTAIPAQAAPRIHRRTQVLPDPSTIAETDPALLSAVEAASLLQARTLHPLELLDACRARSGDFDGGINAWIRLYPDVAREHAQQAAERLSSRQGDTQGQAPLVCGLPIAVKDLVAVRGLPVTASSRVLEGNIASADATIWRKLRDAGAVLMGHAHTDEFALGTRTPQVGNPWDLSASVGGSSGGSAAALAARFAPVAIGTDTGGSLRIPASRCGVSAIKPTFGRCSKHGIIPLLWTRDHVGAMGRSVADAALLLSYMAGPDDLDPVTRVADDVPAHGYATAASGRAKPLAGKRFGTIARPDNLPAPLATLFTAFLDKLRELGGEIVEARLPQIPIGMLTGDNCEMGLYHNQFADRLDRYRPESAALVAVGLASQATVLADYWKLERERATYQRAYNRMFAENDLDAVVMPGVTDDGVKRTDAFPGESFLSRPADTVMWANYTGAPVVSVPVGRSATTGIPFGVQLGGLPWGEAGLIEIAVEIQAVEQSWREMPPVAPNRRELPNVGLAAPGPGPTPTNTDSSGPSFRFVPTLSTVGG